MEHRWLRWILTISFIITLVIFALLCLQSVQIMLALARNKITHWDVYKLAIMPVFAVAYLWAYRRLSGSIVEYLLGKR